MAVFKERDKQHFPLENVKSVVDFFRDHLENNDDPNLALLSIILGCIENSLTVNRTPKSGVEAGEWKPIFPVLQLDTVEALYHRFVAHMKSNVDLSQYDTRYATRELIKKTSDVIWNCLPRRNYKDKAHIHTLYTLLTGSMLDCFGLALAVVAGCQVLDYTDVHLALSEDHAWVVYGEDGSSTAEVTWHGKGQEDKRGQPVGEGVVQRSWLYVNGRPVVCTRAMEVAAMVSAINPAINATLDSVELGTLQQELLWLLYDLGHLDRYPMGLGNIGDCEEICPTPGRPSSVRLFLKSIDASRRYYDNMHVYPYTYLGGYYYRKQKYGEALRSWAQAASVIAKYNYSRDDEEIYKEFLEIANEYIPHMMKTCSEGLSLQNGRALLLDPEIYGLLLQFYDGICQWEEGSNTPVLHITWATHLAFSLAKFDGYAREHCLVEGNDGSESEGEEGEDERRVNNNNTKRRRPADDEIKSTIEALESKVGDVNEPQNPNLAALAHACGESILNPEYLLCGGEPFTSSATLTTNGKSSESTAAHSHLISTQAQGSPYPGLTMDSMLKADSAADVFKSSIPCGSPHVSELGGSLTSSATAPPRVVLRSAKMKAIRKLLVAEKLNASAIKLQMTAQSQVYLKHSKVGSEPSMPRKRLRRE